jgi:hypothetical protein
MTKPLNLLPVLVLVLCAAGQVLASPAATLVSEKPGPPPAGLLAQYAAVVTHTHNWRVSEGNAQGNFEDAEKSLVAWCARLGIRAIGVGSAWDPENDALFDRFEGRDRDLYYSGRFDQRSVMQTAHIRGLLAHLDDLSGGRTSFYLDNETPKTRMGHVWWFGYYYDFPAWHDYSQDRPVKFYRDDPSVEINPLNGQPHVRRNLFEIMAVQHAAGAFAVFAHPTRWWTSEGRFITNIAAMSALFLAANGCLDGLAVMGDRPFNKSYQDLWLDFLDTGARVPGFAETDFFLNQAAARSGQQTFRNYLHMNGHNMSAEAIRDAARTSDLFMSNGAFLSISVDGVPMGSVCPTATGKQHRIRVEAYPGQEGRFSQIQLVGRHGAVLAAVRDFPGGELQFEFPGTGEPDYVLARAFGPGDDPEGAPKEVKHAAITNPVYLHPSDFQIRPASTACVFHVSATSRWIGGSIEFQQTGGRTIERRKVDAGTMRVTLPADARVLLRNPGLNDWMFYIAMENTHVEKLLSYLADGEFRRDYPDLPQGEVPPQAFHLAEMREALAAFDYKLD